MNINVFYKHSIDHLNNLINIIWINKLALCWYSGNNANAPLNMCTLNTEKNSFNFLFCIQYIQDIYAQQVTYFIQYTMIK